jgi:hypothetical protein
MGAILSRLSRALPHSLAISVNFETAGVAEDPAAPEFGIGIGPFFES